MHHVSRWSHSWMQTLGVTKLHFIRLCVQGGSRKLHLNLEFIFCVRRIAALALLWIRNNMVSMSSLTGSHSETWQLFPHVFQMREICHYFFSSYVRTSFYSEQFNRTGLWCETGLLTDAPGKYVNTFLCCSYARICVRLKCLCWSMALPQSRTLTHFLFYRQSHSLKSVVLQSFDFLNPPPTPHI